MATPGKMKGVSPHEIAKLANKGGQKAAAAALGVSTATISTALKNAGYIPHTVYVLQHDPNSRGAKVYTKGDIAS